MLRIIDLLAAEHGVDLATKIHGIGQCEKPFKRFVVQAIFGKVKKYPRTFGRQSLTPVGIFREKLS
jgi:hypothetical protein